jgi:hypothetical protein
MFIYSLIAFCLLVLDEKRSNVSRENTRPLKIRLMCVCFRNIYLPLHFTVCFLFNYYIRKQAQWEQQRQINKTFRILIIILIIDENKMYFSYV